MIYHPIHYKYLTERFIKRVKEVHSDKYDYSKISYTTADTNIEIICPIHGSFFNLPRTIINRKTPCPKCFRPNPPKGKYVRKTPLPPLPDEFVDGNPKWIKFCPKCNQKQYYKHYKFRNRALNKKNGGFCKCCQIKIYFVDNIPWIKKCVDCNEDVIYNSKQGFLSKKQCRCKKCSKLWLRINNSKSSINRFSQIQKSGYKYKDYIFPNGRIEKVQGYEAYTLNYLISSSISQDDIKVKHSEKPKLSYVLDGISRPYTPDAFISNVNLVIETKSPWTWKRDLDKNLAKIKGVNDAGYNMRVIIWNGDRKLISDILYPKTV